MNPGWTQIFSLQHGLNITPNSYVEAVITGLSVFGDGVAEEVMEVK